MALPAVDSAAADQVTAHLDAEGIAIGAASNGEHVVSTTGADSTAVERAAAGRPEFYRSAGT